MNRSTRLVLGSALAICAGWGFYSVMLDAILPRIDYVNMMGDSPDWHRVGLWFVCSSVVAAAALVMLWPILRDVIGTDVGKFAARPFAFYTSLSKRFKVQIVIGFALGILGIIAFAFNFVMLSQMMTYGHNFSERYELSILATYVALFCLCCVPIVFGATALEIQLKKRKAATPDVDAT